MMRLGRRVLLLTIPALLAARPAAAARPPTVANFGFMQTTTAEGRAAVLPLRHTTVRAQIVGVMSSVQVTQHFRNPYAKPIEAVYVFPLPHRAAVHGLSLQLGKRVVTAEVKRREEARAVYERAKRQGKTASLLEQERPNVFTQSLANILPGESIKVTLSYVEELVPREGEYELVFPMVVGPRYVGEGSTTADGSRVASPTASPDTRPGSDISLSALVNAGVAISDLRSPSHKVSIKQAASDLAEVTLDRADRLANRDFVLKYRLTGARPQVTLLANWSGAAQVGRSGGAAATKTQDERGGHFLLMLQPQRQLTRAETAPRELFLVADTSGSMDGVPLQRVKQIAKLCLGALGPRDTFQVIRFSSDAELLAPKPLAPTAENVSRGVAFLETMGAGGGTEFAAALALALKSGRDPKRARIILFMSDGLIGHEAEVLRYLRENRAGANLFALGLGSSVNRFLIDGMARIGQGEPFVLLNSEPEGSLVKRLFELVSRPALTSISVDFGGLQVSEVTPTQPADLFADRPIVVAGRYAKGGSGEVTVRGFLAGKPFKQKLRVGLPEAAVAGSRPAISYLWARRRIDELMDLHDTSPDERGPAKEKVIALALRYNLMSKFTSFVAVDRAVRNESGELETRVVPQRPPEQTPAVPRPTLRTAQQPAGRSAPRAEDRLAHGALSHDRVMPGDPEVVIRAPGAAQVTLVLPTGELITCVRDRAASDTWRASFLIPQAIAGGIHRLRVLIRLASGEQLTRAVRFQVDGVAPRARLELPARARPGSPLQLLARPERLPPAPPASPDEIGDPSFSARVLQDLAAVEVLLPSGEVVHARPRADGAFALSFAAPARPGRYPVAVVLRDHARNKTRQVLWLEVAP